MMKKIIVLTGLLIVAAVVPASAQPPSLTRHLEEKILQVQNPTEEEVSVAAVLQKLQEAKVLIKGNIQFPASVKDQRNAGPIFGCLMPLMYSYTKLRAKDKESAHKAGAMIAREKFVSKDETVFELESFIEKYIDNVTIPKLAGEFLQFKSYIHEDASLYPKPGL